MYELVVKNPSVSKEIFNIDKEGPKPRKDFAKWSDVREKIFYFFDELFYNEASENIEYPKNMSMEEAKRIIEAYEKAYNFNTDKDTWFEDLKAVAVELGYATDRKAFKKEPEAFKGMVSDVAGCVRTALTHRSNTPDLYTIMQILGEEKVRERMKKFIK